MFLSTRLIYFAALEMNLKPLILGERHLLHVISFLTLFVARNAE